MDSCGLCQIQIFLHFYLSCFGNLVKSSLAFCCWIFSTSTCSSVYHTYFHYCHFPVTFHEAKHPLLTSASNTELLSTKLALAGCPLLCNICTKLNTLGYIKIQNNSLFLRYPFHSSGTNSHSIGKVTQIRFVPHSSDRCEPDELFVQVYLLLYIELLSDDWINTH